MKVLLSIGFTVLAITGCLSRTHNESGAMNLTPDHQFHEYPFEDEEEYIKKSVKLALEAIQKNRERDGDGVTRRDAHPKAHGCVTANFEVSSSVPTKGKAGVFATPTKFPAWVRFSNAATVGSDRSLDARGIAIKLMKVPGKKLLDDELNADTQDFLLVNDPVFPARNIKQYSQLQSNSVLYLATHPREALLAARAVNRKIETPLESNYWSMSAFRLGNEAVKYKVMPCKAPSYEAQDKKDPNYLRTALKDQLSNGSGCFDMYVQFFLNEKSTPVEDPSVEWSEEDAPLVKVGTLTIPKQTFDTAEQNKMCEHMSFTPWHSLPEQRPLGNLNRARFAVYRAVSIQRHKDNGAPRVEPTPGN